MPRNIIRPHGNDREAIREYLQQFEGTNLWIKVGRKTNFWDYDLYINIQEVHDTYVEAYALGDVYVELPVEYAAENDFIGLEIREFVESGCEFDLFEYSLDEIILFDDCYCITTEEILENFEHFVNGIS